MLNEENTVAEEMNLEDSSLSDNLIIHNPLI